MKVLIISHDVEMTRLVKEALKDNPNVGAIKVVDTYEKAKGSIGEIRVIVDCIANELGIVELKPLCEKMHIIYKIPEFERVSADSVK